VSNRMQQDLRDDFMTRAAGPTAFGHFVRLPLAALPLLVSVLTLLSPAYSLDTTRPKLPQLSTSRGPIQSGSTIKEAIQGSIDMLLIDMPMTDGEVQQVYDARRVRLLHVATAVTAVVPCYNVDGLKARLNFSSEILAGIFLGKITKWNDPAVVAANPAAHLPATSIVLIAHSGEDGGTYALSDFLSKTNPAWRSSVGRVRSLASRAVLSAESPEDIAELVRRTPNSITYLELWAAKGGNLEVGRVKNRSNNYIDPTPVSIGTAAETATAQIGDDFRASLTDTSGSRDYPIASFIWIVIPDTFGDAEKRDVVLSFLKWVLTEGQNSPESVNLARLPRSVAGRELQMIESRVH